MIRNHIFTSFRGDAKRRTRNDGSQPHLPAGQVLHDLLAAAADRVDLDLAVDALDLDAAHIAGAAENLHRLGSAERHGLRRLLFSMQISATGFSPWSSRHASISSHACDAATRCAISTSLCRIT